MSSIALPNVNKQLGGQASLQPVKQTFELLANNESSKIFNKHDSSIITAGGTSAIDGEASRIEPSPTYKHRRDNSLGNGELEA